MVKTGYSRNTCSDDMTLIWLGVFRNGDTQFSYDSAGIYADDICLTVHADGSKEIEYIYEYEKRVDKMQICETGRKTMECPYCKKEMKEGILSGDARQGVSWKQGDKKAAKR